MKRLITLILSLLLTSLCVHGAEQYRFRMLDTNGGLPDNNVRNLVMLPNGLMCIQTSSMLNLYNGTTCNSYRYNPVEIPYNEYSGLNNTFYDAAANRLWCTSRDHTWCFDLNHHRFEYDINITLGEYGLSGVGQVTGFFIDSHNNYWVVDENALIHRCNISQRTTKQIEALEGMTAPIKMIQVGSSIWMLSLNGTIAEYDTALDSFRSISTLPISQNGGQPSRMDMVKTSSGNLWIMFDRDLIYFDTSTRTSLRTKIVPLGKNDLYTTIDIDSKDNLWVGSARSGVSIINTSTMSCQTLPYLEQTDGDKIYHHTDISKIYIDNRGGVWIATLAEGLLYWHSDIIRLKNINNSSLDSGRMTDESVKCMVEDSDGTLLVGTIDGLLRYDPQRNAVDIPYPSLRHELCISLYRDSRNRIWLGTFNNGAFMIDRGKIRHYTYPEMSAVDISYFDSTPNYNCVRTFLELPDGSFWVSVYGGVGRFHIDSGKIELLSKRHEELSRFMMVRDICYRPDGMLLCSGDNGRFLYAPTEDRVETNVHSAECYSPSNQTFIDKHNIQWIATADGLTITDLETQKRWRITMEDGLPNNNILSIAPDNLGNIWVATFSHIVRIKPTYEGDDLAFAFSTFDSGDGIKASAFFQKSYAVHSNGNIYFGGAHGICEVCPTELYQRNYNVKPIISSLQIFGHTINVGEQYNGRCILDTDLEHVERIRLNHDESFLTFEFSSLNYANPQHTSYRYKLENFDKQWNEIRSQDIGRATYTFLQPGEYVFRVMSADNDNDWSREQAELHITIAPPFWLSTTAFVIYVLIFIILTVLTSLYMRRRIVRRNTYRQALAEQKQREELDQMKYRFFTNISHELRTPLSLIILPLESLIRDSQESSILPQLENMRRNALQLLSLVNNLLDFRKLEQGGEKLHLMRGNISVFVENMVENFRDATQRKELSLEFENTLSSNTMYFDTQQMQRIVNNLLSNALKYTPSGGGISVRLTETSSKDSTGEAIRMMLLEVSDTGIGISKHDLPHIFDRFYQSDNKSADSVGSGIGLHMVKQYVEMHSGTITALSEPGQGTTFRVMIPMNLHGTSEDYSTEIATPTESESQPRTSSKETLSLLIIDDHSEFRQYMADELSTTYKVYQAEDGEKGLKSVAKHHPDIIICDVMMPNMDGFEFTRRIKSDIATSHIPVVLLTARADDDIRRDGYETGADAYLTKPFKMEILQARIRNLIEERRRRISIFSSNIEVSPSQITGSSIDESLMQRIISVVEQNMDNPDFSVEELSAEIGMHRMHLYRKLQSIADMTPSEFIRSMRLKRAAQIFREREGINVSEVSDMVGFNTTKYFTRYFREMFGVTPSQYASEIKRTLKKSDKG